MSKVRARGQLLPVVGVVLLVMLTLGNAAANMIPVHRPTQAEQQAEDRAEIVAQRRARIAELGRAPACQAATSHELVRLLAMNGQGVAAHVFADTYEARCGTDPVVRHWGDAPRPRAVH